MSDGLARWSHDYRCPSIIETHRDDGFGLDHSAGSRAEGRWEEEMGRERAIWHNALMVDGLDVGDASAPRGQGGSSGEEE